MFYEKISLHGKHNSNESEQEENEKNKKYCFVEEHPSKGYICLRKRTVPTIPLITSTKELPDIMDLDQNNNKPDTGVKELREKYAKIALILFCLLTQSLC